MYPHNDLNGGAPPGGPEGQYGKEKEEKEKGGKTQS